MKILKYIIPLFILALFSQSCEKFLEKQPLGQETDENFYNNPTNAVMAINSCYDPISWDEGSQVNGGIYSAHTYEFLYGDILSDDSRKGSQPNDYLEIEKMEKWTLTSDQAFIDMSTWGNMFAAIYRANSVLVNLPNASINIDLKSRLLGEAFFIRAYSYFNLVIKFGGVPIFKQPVPFTQWGNVKRNTIADTYKQIMDDCDSAANLLPLKYTSLTDLGRATKGSAMAYKARAIMYQLGINNANQVTWQQVYDITNTIMLSGSYNLVPNYATIFEYEGENNAESIFEIQYCEDNGEYNADKRTGTANNLIQQNRKTWGWGFNNPTDDLMNSFDATDPRKQCTAFADGQYVYGAQQLVDYPANNMTPYLNRKVALATKPKSDRGSGANVRKFRFSDILLMHAEAAYYLTKEGEAQSMLKIVRDRLKTSTLPKGTSAGSLDYSPASSALPDITATGTDLLKAIWTERRHEFAMEGLRYYDLVRTGQYLDILEKKFDATIRANCVTHCIDNTLDPEMINPLPVQPIPNSESVTWKLEQNPGY